MVPKYLIINQLPKKTISGKYILLNNVYFDKQELLNNKLDFEELPELYTDKKELIKICDYLDNLYLKYLKLIAQKLNEIHNTDFSLRFWELPLSLFLLHYLHIFYNKYYRIKKAAEIFNKNELVFLTKNGINSYDKKNRDTFVNYSCINNDGILYIYSRISEILGIKIEFSYFDDKVNDEFLSTQLAENNLLKKKIKFKITDYLSKLNFFYFKELLLNKLFFVNLLEKKILVSARLFNRKDILNIKRRSNILFEFFDNKHFSSSKINVNRNLLRTIEYNDEFEKIVVELLPNYLPEFLLEEFKSYYDEALSYSNYDCYISLNTLASNPVYNFAASIGMEQGAEFIGHQHGGGYGQYNRISFELAERHISNYYITWGWKDKHYMTKAKLFSLPECGLSNYYNSYNVKNVNDKIVIVNSCVPKEIIRFYSAPDFYLNYTNYLKNKDKFLSNLDKAILKNLIYRPYMQKYQWGKEEKLILNKYKEITIDNNGGLRELLKKVKLYICDYMSTSFIESLVIGTPTILFWSQNAFDEREEAKPAFDLLRKSGVLFHSPEEAANKVNEVCDNVLEWWNEPHRQQARLEFLKMQCNVDENWKEIWIETLKNI